MRCLIVFFTLSFFSYKGVAQYGHVDHWETAIYTSEEWRYFVGTQAPDTGWKNVNFNHNSWPKGKGGLGFGYSNLKTTVPKANSLYLRKTFTIRDKSKLQAAILSMDWDDGFVVYFNGFEVARENIGTPWVEPQYNEYAGYERKAQLVDGGKYSDFLVRKNQLNYAVQNGSNVVAVQVHNVSNVSPDLAAFVNLFFGITDTSSQWVPAPHWFNTPPVFADSSTLPIVKLTSARLNDSSKIYGLMEITDNGKGKRNSFYQPGNHYSGRIGLKYRGNSTLQFPKKSFTLETRNAAGKAEDVSLLGLPADNDWVLYAPYTDKSLLRNYVAYGLGQGMQEYAPRTRLVEVFHNGYYIGVYLLTEKVKRGDNRVKVNKITPADTNSRSITGGYILRKDWDNDTNSNAFFLPHDKTHSGFENIYIQYYKPEYNELTASQRKYVKDYVWNFENTLLSEDFKDLKAGYSQYVDLNSFADYFISNEMAKEIDAYRFSMYLYKNHEEDDNLLHLAPIWDYNLGFGNIDFGEEQDKDPRGWMYDNGKIRVFWFDKMLQDQLFADVLDCRWRNYRMTSMTTEKINRLIDNAVIEMDSAADRNHYTWKTLGRYVWPNKFVGETYEEEIDYLKTWLKERLDFMDINMMGYCRAPLAVNDLEQKESSIAIFPNPTNSIVQIKSEVKIESLEVYNILGNLVYSKPSINTSEASIDLSLFPPGLYTIRLHNEEGESLSKKLVKSE